MTITKKCGTKQIGVNMFYLLSKGSALLALLCVMSSSLMAWDECCYSCPPSCPPECKTNRFYIGAFGGGIYSDSSKASQQGTAFFLEAQGGPLAVLAEGHFKRQSTGFGGVQVGYEFANNNNCSDWSIAPAAELEAYFFSHRQSGHFINQSGRLDEHDFANSFRSNSSVILVNAVIGLNNSCWSSFTPYVGGGIGAANIRLNKADSLQVSPPEPGVNHFNSKRSDSSWAFAAQAKAGLRYNFSSSFHIFGEYRYLYVDASNYIFGSTVSPGHAATSPWNFKINDINYNAFAFGIQFDL